MTKSSIDQNGQVKITHLKRKNISLKKALNNNPRKSWLEKKPLNRTRDPKNEYYNF
jgi:hypothetical protein